MGNKAIGVINGEKSQVNDLSASTINDVKINRGANNEFKNLFIGDQHGSSCTGNQIVALGYRAFELVNTAVESVAVGALAGAAQVGGYNNVYVGQEAGSFNVNGIRNTALGSFAMIFNEGDENVVIGYNAGAGMFAGSRNVVIGSYSGFNYDGNDKLIIANNMTSTLISGDFALKKIGINVEPGNQESSAALQVDSTDGGFLGPRMTTTQRNALSPVAGVEIFNTTTNKKEVYNGTYWHDKDDLIIATKTSSYTITNENIIRANGSSPMTITLPSAVGYKKIITVKQTGSADLTIAGTLSQTIDGDANIVLKGGRNDSATFFSDNSNWWII